jgi:1-acyl-sn-glycerol-3-phosphate acyltransferase
VKLNRWNNGTVIIEMLPPVETTNKSKEHVRPLIKACHEQMSAKITQLDAEVAELDNNGAQKGAK